MNIGIPKEVLEHEARVACSPETVKKYIELGLTVSVERGAGLRAGLLDAFYEDAGAKIAEGSEELYRDADIVLKVRQPDDREVSCLKEGTILIALLQPLVHKDLMQKLALKNVTSLAIDMVPRIARAQKLDALSSQSNVAGYKAVLMAANYLGKMIPMMMTAAGTIPAAKVLVLGAGVAGLQAIATAKRLGAIVEAFDVRPAVKEQVESLGAKFLSIEATEESEDKQGYAKEQSTDAKKQGEALVAEHCKNADIVITTALIPGKPSPKLISADMVQSMSQGSVIVDLAMEGGGNCELSEAGKDVEKFGVMLMGPMNVPSLMAEQSSQLYARNVYNYFTEMYAEKEFNLDLKNEVIKGSLITHEGQVVHEMMQSLAKQSGA